MALNLSLIPVTYRHGEESKLHKEEGTGCIRDMWFYDAPWMPVGTVRTIEVTQIGLDMMTVEQNEGEPQPADTPVYSNARRFYRDVVEKEIHDSQTP